MPKVINAKNWDLTPAADGRRYSKYPDGTLPAPDPAAWELPSAISIPAGSYAEVRPYANNARDYEITVTGLVAGLTYNSGTERINAAAEAVTGSSSATFTIVIPGGTNVVESISVGVIAATAVDIAWDGDFQNGNFKQYHITGNTEEVHFHAVPPYGRPIQYGGQHPIHIGNGDLLSLVAKTERTVGGIHYPIGPTRGSSEYAPKFTVKNSANGSEPADNDPAGNISTLRRTDLQLTDGWNLDYEGMPPGTERYITFSIYLDPDFNGGGTGFGVVLWGSKAVGGGGAGWLGIIAQPSGWTWEHRPSVTDSLQTDWWHTMQYRWDRPSASYWPQGLVDFPNEAASKAILSNLNRGAWTDFIVHYKPNPTLPVSTNDGFINIHMRHGSAAWVHVLNILPLEDINLGGSPDRYYDRVIARSTTEGYTNSYGLYGSKERFWPHSTNTVCYYANVRSIRPTATLQQVKDTFF